MTTQAGQNLSDRLALDALVEGAAVHYVLDATSLFPGHVRGALVSLVTDRAAGTVNLHVHLNGTEFTVYPGHTWLVLGVPYDPAGAQGTWHFMGGP